MEVKFTRLWETHRWDTESHEVPEGITDQTELRKWAHKCTPNAEPGLVMVIAQCEGTVIAVTEIEEG